MDAVRNLLDTGIQKKIKYCYYIGHIDMIGMKVVEGKQKKEKLATRFNMG